MTNAQKWIAAFLGIFLFLFILSKLTKQEDDYYDDADHYNDQTAEPVKEVDGFTLINRIGCTKCHGEDLNGSKLAPTLYEAKNNWKRDALINYLRNPQAYSGDERFEEYKRQYKSIMPAYNNIDVKDLGIIADYILSMQK